MAFFILVLSASIPLAHAGSSCGSGESVDGMISDLTSVLPDGASSVADLPPPPVYYGTARPSHVELTEGQVQAIGFWGDCSGTLINDQWVLTADHCRITEGREFCIGADPADPDVCFEAEFVVDNPDADMTLVRLDQVVTDVHPDVEPIPLLDENLDSSWLGETLEAAGYGQQEDGSFGEREFSAEPLVDLDGHMLTIDGQGERGVCFGDSGGPVMVVDSEGQTRVAGTLSNGDSSCLGRDNYTRVDTNIEWIEQYVGPVGEEHETDSGSDSDEDAVSDADYTYDEPSGGWWQSFWGSLFGG